jgi:predicted metal-dependent phosphoesterase TrpH
MAAPPVRVGAIHVHTAYSRDGHDSVTRLADTARRAGVQFVAVSDHAEDVDADRYAALCAECAAVSDAECTVIPGLEYRFAGFRGLHLLALGLTARIDPETPDDFMRDAPAVTGLTVLAHPVLPRYEVPDSVAAGIDAIEVWNGVYNTRHLPDPRAMRLLQRIRQTRPSVVAVAGLDQHDATNDRELRVIVTGTGDPLAAMRAGAFTNRGRTMSFGPHIDWPAYGLPTLHVARFLFDRVERTQDRLVRALRRR